MRSVCGLVSESMREQLEEGVMAQLQQDLPGALVST